MTVLARPAALTEYNQADHNACGPIAVAACLDALGLPTNWQDLRTWMGGDAQGTFGSQLVTAAKRRDPSVIAFTTVDDPHVVVAKWIPQGYYVLMAGQCYGNAEPAPLGSTAISHWFIVYGNVWQCCNIWTGVYPTYPNLAASYVSRIGCVILGRSASPVSNPTPVGGTPEGAIEVISATDPLYVKIEQQIINLDDSRQGFDTMLTPLISPNFGGGAAWNAALEKRLEAIEAAVKAASSGGMTQAQATQLADTVAAVARIEAALKNA